MNEIKLKIKGRAESEPKFNIRCKYIALDFIDGSQAVINVKDSRIEFAGDQFTVDANLDHYATIKAFKGPHDRLSTEYALSRNPIIGIDCVAFLAHGNDARIVRIYDLEIKVPNLFDGDYDNVFIPHAACAAAGIRHFEYK